MNDNGQQGGAVLAQGGVDLMRELKRNLSKHGITAELIKPPGFTGKG